MQYYRYLLFSIGSRSAASQSRVYAGATIGDYRINRLDIFSDSSSVKHCINIDKEIGILWPKPIVSHIFICTTALRYKLSFPNQRTHQSISSTLLCRRLTRNLTPALRQSQARSKRRRCRTINGDRRFSRLEQFYVLLHTILFSSSS